VNILVVPFFALFGAFLSDQRGDVRDRSPNALYFRRKGLERARRQSGGEASNVAVEEQAYDALRKVAQLRIKSEEAVKDARLLASQLDPDSPAGAVASRLLGRLEERGRLLEGLEGSVRQTAIERAR
jgi:hypothetical protein